jgi:hypothetical protein
MRYGEHLTFIDKTYTICLCSVSQTPMKNEVQGLARISTAAQVGIPDRLAVPARSSTKPLTRLIHRLRTRNQVASFHGTRRTTHTTHDPAAGQRWQTGPGTDKADPILSNKLGSHQVKQRLHASHLKVAAACHTVTRLAFLLHSISIVPAARSLHTTITRLPLRNYQRYWNANQED